MDLLDDLQHALLEAGAVAFAANDYIRIPNPISRAVEKLAIGELNQIARKREDREWFVSAPGKVILFGEHAVVHGVVRRILDQSYHHSVNFCFYRPQLRHQSICAVMASRRPGMTISCLSTSLILVTTTMSGTWMTYRGMLFRPSILEKSIQTY